MTRILALVVGLLLIAAPAWWLRDVTVPLPAYRQAGYASFLFFGQALLAIYGSVLLGIAVHLAGAKGSPQPVSPFKFFQAGALGALVVCAAFLVGGSVYSLAKYGAFDKANRWESLGPVGDLLGDPRRHRFGRRGLAILCLAGSCRAVRRDARKQWVGSAALVTPFTQR